MDKYDYKSAILSELRGTTGLSFQIKMGIVLSKYYTELKKTYEMPSPYGGDDKNDGWVVEDALFYQIYGPTQLKLSLSKNIQNKFKEDLTELIKKIKEGKWNGRIKKFIFIVNTFDVPLPKDSDRFYDKVVEKVKIENGIEFEYIIKNLDYIDNILNKISNIEVLKDMVSALKVKNIIPVDSITEKMLLDTVEIIGSNFNNKMIGKLNFGDYEKVSTIKKIYINKLDEKKEEIELFMKHLDVVENTVRIINEDIRSANTFERVVGLVISKYEMLSNKYSDVVLLEKLSIEIQKYSPGIGFTENSTKLLIVYIFDKCDIFEKEEGEGYDITK